MRLEERSFPRKWESNIIPSILIIPLIICFDRGTFVDNRYYLFLSGMSLILFLTYCSSSSNFERYDRLEGNFIEYGIASWYGPNFHGNKTANGEIFNTNELTAAHRTLPFNSIIRVVNSENDKSVIVRINDRGPYAKNRIIDLSKKAAEELDIIRDGTGKVTLFLLSDHDLPSNLKEPQYTVQVGSYKKRSDADNFSVQFSDSRVVKTIINGDAFYRVYVGSFSSKNDAEDLLNELHRNGIDGFVKQVEN